MLAEIGTGTPTPAHWIRIQEMGSELRTGRMHEALGKRSPSPSMPFDHDSSSARPVEGYLLYRPRLAWVGVGAHLLGSAPEMPSHAIWVRSTQALSESCAPRCHLVGQPSPHQRVSEGSSTHNPSSQQIYSKWNGYSQSPLTIFFALCGRLNTPGSSPGLPDPYHARSL